MTQKVNAFKRNRIGHLDLDERKLDFKDIKEKTKRKQAEF